MALDGASSSDQSNSTGASGRSDGAVQGDLSDRARDALSSGGGAGRASSAHAEPSLDERVASQERLAAEGQVAKETFERRQAAYATRGGAEPGLVDDVSSGGVQLAQAATGTLTDAMPGGLGLDDLARAGRAMRAASPAGAAVAAAIGLERVNDIASQSMVRDAAERLGLDATTVEGALAAEAYASVMERASTGFLPGVDKGRGPDAEISAQAVALTELAAPGSYRSAFDGDPAARARAEGAMQGAVAALEADRLTPVARDWADGWAEVFPGISPGERDLGQLPGFAEGVQAEQSWTEGAIAADPALIGTQSTGSPPPEILPGSIVSTPAAEATGSVVTMENPHSPETVSIPADRATHILDGDKTGGGHRAGTGKPGKTEFPADWGDDRVLEAIREVAGTGEAVGKAHRPGELVIKGTVDDVTIEAIVKANGDVRTAYPTSGTDVVRNPKE